MKTSVWLVDAFTTQPLTGNPAGVVPRADHLTEVQMHAIANELHASETAFVLEADPSTAADFRVRYFTPTTEVDLCGHATIGAICGLVGDGTLLVQGNDVVRIETNVGILPIRYGRDEHGIWAEMGQAKPAFREDATPLHEISSMLGIEVDDIAVHLPREMCSTGLRDMFVPLTSLEVMKKLKPNYGAIEKWNRSQGVASTHVYAIGGEAGHDFHSRDFAPAVGIPEDPMTGTATGALMALLVRHQLAEPNRTYSFEQGYEIGRAGVLKARVDITDGDWSVFVRGHAVRSLIGQLSL